jgi:hypothetical protein
MEFWMAALMRGCRQLTNRSLTADKVSFVHRGSAASELRSFYHCELRFGAEADEMTFISTFDSKYANRKRRPLSQQASDKILRRSLGPPKDL